MWPGVRRSHMWRLACAGAGLGTGHNDVDAHALACGYPEAMVGARLAGFLGVYLICLLLPRCCPPSPPCLCNTVTRALYLAWALWQSDSCVRMAVVPQMPTAPFLCPSSVAWHVRVHKKVNNS